ncbi:hypothetical protein NDN08_002553 [Rhodosorus marinus]|uniref:CBM20 domain-containing protein n=1 Tax=Rhodosorus marinus TaxID=101924 RepID=A0AAV8UY46_9RHOD|nr:hypothetical protein NDN08_002553 [Rhodosorus marinus]
MSGIRAEFTVKCSTKFGENVGIIGSDRALGRWKTNGVVKLNTNESAYPSWSCQVEIQGEGEVEYKYVILKGNRIKKWELEGRKNNRTILIERTEAGGSVVRDDGEFNKLPSDLVHQPAAVSEERTNGNVSVGDDRQQVARFSPSEGSFLSHLQKESSTSRSWRKRLSYIRALLSDPNCAAQNAFDPKSLNDLAIVVVYLTFVSSGQIACEEDGSHYRPNHHANEARKIEEALSQISNDQNAYLIRKIYPLLPSYRSEFTASVPLTRIRDIAHRNDIPHELKQEIKHTLQNKLHRSAGPEDLVTTENLLNRITAPGAQYSGGFVSEFQIFYRELREFFNATDLDENLKELMQKEEPRKSSFAVLKEFLDLKSAGVKAIVQLEALLNLRREISYAMNDLEPGEVMQRVRLVDIQLEKFSFVLLAGINNTNLKWATTLHAMSLALEGIKLSGVQSVEAGSILSELKLVSESDPLRAKASAERCVRFCDDFTKQTAELFEESVKVVGGAFNVEQRAVSVFIEAEVRSTVVFQFSRLASWTMRNVRTLLGQPPWDVLFPGTATGSLLFAQSISEIPERELQQPRVVVLDRAEGDEDIPQAIKGIVLGHELPHLSHLGVRARQAKVVFINSEDATVFKDFKKGWVSNAENLVKLVVSLGVDSLSMEDAADTRAKEDSDTRDKVVIDIPDPVAKRALVVATTDVSKESAGTKASSAGILEAAAKENQDFEVPRGVVVPFSSFQRAALAGGPELDYFGILQGFDELSLAEKETRAEAVAATILYKFPLNQDIVRKIQGNFGKETLLMVRSSANCEDLEEMSGAGLYDSFANVPVSDRGAIAEAVRKVWSSLWTKRAALSRSQYKVPHEKVVMAVLVQEMLEAELSFIMFSNNPINGATNEVYIEMAVGMGETLASAEVRGSPYRLVYNTDTDRAEVLALASFSYSLEPGGGNLGLEKKAVDYSTVKMTTSSDWREEMTRRLARIAKFLEAHYGKPQDIEGVVVGETIYLVQSRAMVK